MIYSESETNESESETSEVSRTNRRMYRLVDGASLVWSRTLWVEFGVRLSDL